MCLIKSVPKGMSREEPQTLTKASTLLGCSRLSNVFSMHVVLALHGQTSATPWKVVRCPTWHVHRMQLVFNRVLTTVRTEEFENGAAVFTSNALQVSSSMCTCT
jgi:hypothetical protein